MECQVCCNAESGNHYGTICCRACAAFFRRTVHMKLVYRCRKNGTCSLRKETRYCCRFCRMKRCIDIGMTTEENPGTSYDMHLDSSEFYPFPPDLLETAHEFYNIQRIYEDHALFLSDFKNRLNAILVKTPLTPKLPYKLSLFQQIAAAYDHHNEHWPKSTKEGLNLHAPMDFNAMMCEYYEEFEHIASFCMEIEAFTKLSLQQKWIVMKRFSMRFMAIDRAFVTVKLLGANPDDRRVVTLGGLAANYEMSEYDLTGITDMPEEDLKRMFIDSETKYDVAFVRPFKKINPDHFEFLYLLISSLWDLENHWGIASETLQISHSVKERLSEELHFYYKVEKNLPNYASRIYKIASLITAMDMECRICSHPDGGNHYNTITCRACAAFFRRSIQMKMTYRCKKNGNCELNCTTSRVNRFSCRYCRLMRCFEIGMEMDEDSLPPDDECPNMPCIVNVDEYINNCHLQLNCSTSRLPSFDEDDEFFSPNNLFKDIPAFLKDIQRRLHTILSKERTQSDVPYNRSLCQQAAVAYANHREKWPTCTKEKMNFERVIVLNKLICDYSREFGYIGEFCMEIEPFAELPLNEKTVVMKRFAKKFMSIDQVATSIQLLGLGDPDDSKLVTINGQVCDYKTSKYDCSVISDYTEEMLKGWFVGTEEKFIQLYVKPFKALNPDRFEVIYLLMSALWDVENECCPCLSPKTKEVATGVRLRLAEELNFYYQFEKKTTNYASRIYKLNNLTSALDRIAELKKQDSQGAMTFELCKIDMNLHDLTL